MLVTKLMPKKKHDKTYHAFFNTFDVFIFYLRLNFSFLFQSYHKIDRFLVK